eukprot:2893899-Pleurochrysis_carterae.AAC.1
MCVPLSLAAARCRLAPHLQRCELLSRRLRGLLRVLPLERRGLEPRDILLGEGDRVLFEELHLLPKRLEGGVDGGGAAAHLPDVRHRLHQRRLIVVAHLRREARMHALHEADELRQREADRVVQVLREGKHPLGHPGGERLPHRLGINAQPALGRRRRQRRDGHRLLLVARNLGVEHLERRLGPRRGGGDGGVGGAGGGVVGGGGRAGGGVGCSGADDSFDSAVRGRHLAIVALGCIACLSDRFGPSREECMQRDADVSGPQRLVAQVRQLELVAVHL